MLRTWIIACLCFGVLSSHGEHLKGYNAAHIFQPFPGNQINAEALGLFDALSPDVLRFPGGTVANKYHFYKKGYGFSKADLKQKENYAVDFVRLVRSLEQPPNVIYVMNLLEHFKGADEQALMQENLDALKYLIDQGLDIIAVELGNEFYLYPEVTGGSAKATINPEDQNEVDVPAEVKKGNLLTRWLRALTGLFSAPKQPAKAEANTANANFVYYASLCREYRKRIHAIDPGIRLGIPLGNIRNQKHTAYNDFVLEHMDFTDAYVCHFYGTFSKDCAQSDEACIRKGLDWYLRSILEPALALVQSKNKEIWITEWNALKFGHYGDEGTWIRNSPIHVEYTRKFIEAFDRHGVAISNFHKLAGPMEGAAYNAIDVDDRGKCHTTPIYDILKAHY